MFLSKTLLTREVLELLEEHDPLILDTVIIKPIIVDLPIENTIQVLKILKKLIEPVILLDGMILEDALFEILPNFVFE